MDRSILDQLIQARIKARQKFLKERSNEPSQGAREQIAEILLMVRIGLEIAFSNFDLLKVLTLQAEKCRHPDKSLVSGGYECLPISTVNQIAMSESGNPQTITVWLVLSETPCIAITIDEHRRFLQVFTELKVIEPFLLSHFQNNCDYNIGGSNGYHRRSLFDVLIELQSSQGFVQVIEENYPEIWDPLITVEP